ncbi:MAG TPA: AMP-binding protein [Blastocatellia bacterium]|nr:AMP-binding protein [Blastocatellia bacterium]
MAEDSYNNLRELIETRAARFPDKPFLADAAMTQIFTYSRFDRAVNQTANLLLSLGVESGDRVSLFLINRLEYLIFYFACFKLGAWAGPINAGLGVAEVAYILGNSEPRVAITESGLYPVLAQAASTVTSISGIVVIEAGESPEPPQVEHASNEPGSRSQTVAYRSAVAGQSSELAPSETGTGSEALIIYTSGTTGKPKGVLLTHGNLLANAREMAAWLKLTEADKALMIMPLFHMNALMTTALAAVWAGGSIVIAPKFSASRHWEIVSQHGVTYFGSVATMLGMLNSTYPTGIPESTGDGERIDTSRLRFALCGSAPVPVEVLKRYEGLFSCPVIEGYGLSETTCRSTFNPIDHPHPGSIGVPIGTEVKIFDDNDRELEPGQIGEIVLRGPSVMKGYYRNERATEAAFRSGWFHSGDLGYRDEEGFFYIVDRKTDMIIRGGENIYPREIDEVLYQHPGVKDAATIAVPDEVYGEEVRSFVVLRDGEQATGKDIMDYCRERLAAFKCPKSVVFLDDIPKGPTGKLLKRELPRQK